MSDTPGYLYKPEPISFGNGYIPYAPGSCGTNGVWMQEGWILPGGTRTTNRHRALAVAVEIDRLYSHLAAQKTNGKQPC